MTWLGHENVCSLQWAPPPCNCPCPDCGLLLNEFPADGCKQPEHNAGRSTHTPPAVVKCASCGDPIRPAGDGWTHHPYNYSTACEKAIYDPPEPRYLGTLDELERHD